MVTTSKLNKRQQELFQISDSKTISKQIKELPPRDRYIYVHEKKTIKHLILDFKELKYIYDFRKDKIFDKNLVFNSKQR